MEEIKNEHASTVEDLNDNIEYSADGGVIDFGIQMDMPIMPLEWSNNQITQALNYLSSISTNTSTIAIRVDTVNTTLTQTNNKLDTVNQGLNLISGQISNLIYLVVVFLCCYVAQYYLRRLFYRG